MTEDTSSGSTTTGSGSGIPGNGSGTTGSGSSGLVGQKVTGSTTEEMIERECPFGSILIDLDECPVA